MNDSPLGGGQTKIKKRSKKVKKIALIALALVMAMGSLGVAYAHWTQTLTITETVQTGKLCVGIRDIGTNDPPPALTETGGMVHPTGTNPTAIPNETGSAGGTEDPGYNKNVASALSENVLPIKCTKNAIDYYHAVQETIKNAYPSYSCTITLEAANCGTVPVKLETYTTVITSDIGGLATFLELAAWEIKLSKDNGANWTTLGSGSGQTAWETWFATNKPQLDPCNLMQMVFTKHIQQTNYLGVLCPEEGSVTLTHSATFTQWNVVP
jgi:hypothetical protein